MTDDAFRAAYRLCGRILPGDFRRAHAAELEEAALGWFHTERRLHGRSRLRLWWHIVADVVMTSVALRWPSLSRDYRYRCPLPEPRRRGLIEVLMDQLRKDLSYSLRALRRQPAFALITILTIALGIGANTAVFSVVNGVILRPLAYPHPERLQFITSQFPNLGFDQFWVDLPEFLDLRDHNRAFESMGAYSVSAINLDTTPPSRPVRAGVTTELMPTLGVSPLAGRWFAAEDAVLGAAPVAILSWELWQRAYGADPGVLNRTVLINAVGTRIVGIMPRGYDIHDQHVEIWQPIIINPQTLPNSRGGHNYYIIGRLKPEVTLAQARSDVDGLLPGWKDQIAGGKHAPNPTTHRIRVDPLKEDVVGSVRQSLLVLQGAVGFVLLIACANLANLLIARADSRMRAYSVRQALGATRWRLFRQLLTEGAVLAGAGAVLGVGLAWAGLRALVSSNSAAIPRTTEVSLDWRVLGFTLVVAAGTGVVFGLVPLLHLGRERAGESFKDAGTRTTAGSARARLRSALVVVEIALAVLLVVGAGLLMRSFVNLMRVDMGFNRAELSTFGVVLSNPPYTPQRRLDFYQQLSTSLKRLPGVRAVASMNGLPPLRSVNANDTDFEHIPNTAPAGQGPVENVDFWQFVDDSYTETMGIGVVKGRAFEAADAGGAPVVLINEATARKFFTDRDPIGQHLRQGFGDTLPWFTIVGVLKDVKQGGVDAAAGTEVYFLTDQMPRVSGFAPGSMNFVVRAASPFETLAPELRRAVNEIDATLPVIRLRSMNDVVDEAVARPRFLTTLLGVFASLALLLAAVGTYGILSYLVSERTREIGIRMALGADRREILRLVLVRGLVLSLLGLTLGLAASIGLTRVIKTMLFNVTPTDPSTLAVVATVIAVMSIIACLVPSLRATRVDPLIVLKDN